MLLRFKRGSITFLEMVVLFFRNMQKYGINKMTVIGER